MAQKTLRRYETLLRVRQRQEDLKAQALAAARQTLAGLRRDRRALEQRRLALLTMADTGPGMALDASQLESVYQFDRHLATVADVKDSEIAAQGDRVRAAREELETAMAQRRIMEKLIERAERAERWRLAQREQREHDESTVMRYAHARRHGTGMQEHGTSTGDSGRRDHRFPGRAGHSAGRDRPVDA